MYLWNETEWSISRGFFSLNRHRSFLCKEDEFFFLTFCVIIRGWKLENYLPLVERGWVWGPQSTKTFFEMREVIFYLYFFKPTIIFRFKEIFRSLFLILKIYVKNLVWLLLVLDLKITLELHKEATVRDISLMKYPEILFRNFYNFQMTGLCVPPFQTIWVDFIADCRDQYF